MIVEIKVPDPMKMPVFAWCLCLQAVAYLVDHSVEF